MLTGIDDEQNEEPRDHNARRASKDARAASLGNRRARPNNLGGYNEKDL